MYLYQGPLLDGSVLRGVFKGSLGVLEVIAWKGAAITENTRSSALGIGLLLRVLNLIAIINRDTLMCTTDPHWGNILVLSSLICIPLRPLINICFSKNSLCCIVIMKMKTYGDDGNSNPEKNLLPDRHQGFQNVASRPAKLPAKTKLFSRLYTGDRIIYVIYMCVCAYMNI